ncbi:MAG: adenine phosphoribosyltransferase [Candidatus Latescibacterota bacterium]|nr:MAG: adenine phosphoribosyltransferase [Candidatus Latescibacterota bacterium]
MADELKRLIRDIPDFPKPGILFRDITPLLSDHAGFRLVVNTLKQRYEGRKIDKIAAIESRGFLFGTPLGYQLGVGVVPMRKPGKLPYKTIRESYALEYGEAALEIHKDAVRPGDQVLIMDDLLATGGTASAAVSLVEKLGGEVVEVCFVIELAGLNGRSRIEGVPVFSLVSYD